MKQDIDIKVLPSDPTAAVPHTMSGWLDRNGQFYGGNSENIARWSGATHIVCVCGKHTPKSYTICGDCRAKKSTEKWLARPEVDWDGTGGLYSLTHDEFFWNGDEVEEYMAENNVTFDRLELVIAEPNYPRVIEPNDYWYDDLPEEKYAEDVFSKDVMDALSHLNDLIQKENPISYQPNGPTRPKDWTKEVVA